MESMESTLFNTVLSNPHHVMYQLLPLEKDIGYNLPQRSHSLRPMSHLQFSRATKLQVWHGESREFLTVVQLYFRIVLLYSVQLCWQNAEHWLVSYHRCFCSACVRCKYLSFCLIYSRLLNLFNSEMEWSDVLMLQLIELYETKPYLCDSRSVQLDSRSVCNFIVQLCCTLAWQNCARRLQVWHRSYSPLRRRFDQEEFHAPDAI